MEVPTYADLEDRCTTAGVTLKDICCLVGYTAYLYQEADYPNIDKLGRMAYFNPRDIDHSEEPLVVCFDYLAETILAMGNTWWNADNFLADQARDLYACFNDVIGDWLLERIL